MQQNGQAGKKEHEACFTVCKVCVDGEEDETVVVELEIAPGQGGLRCIGCQSEGSTGEGKGVS